MNTPSNPTHDSPLGSQAAPSATLTAARPLYWSVRRELWENRSIYIAPLAVAAVMLLGFLIASIGRAMSLADPSQRVAVLAEPTDFAALLIMGTTFVVGIFYCLDALHGERRDRSILFWKSLPVSDLTTVLSKATIPLVVLPLLTFAIIVATQLIMLLLGSAVMRGSGLSAATLWTQASFFQTSLAAPLPPGDRACVLVCANLRLAAADFGLGAARDISMGLLAVGRNLHRRENRLQHLPFRRSAALPPRRQRGRRLLHGP